MFPWGHAAVGYLLYAGYQRADHGRQPEDVPVFALAIGTQLPDLIDKPLAYQFAVLPSGRSLGHSLLFAAVLLGLVWLLSRRDDRQSLAVAFGIGYISHLFADGLYPAIAGNLEHLRYLVYPVIEPVQYDASSDFVAYLVETLLITDPSAVVLFEFGLTAVTLALWYRDGLPGIWLFLPERFKQPADQPK